MDELQAKAKRDALHYMMHIGFIEIRAAKSLNAAQKFGDVFHKLPLRLLNCITAADYDAEFEEMLVRAKRNGLDGYLIELREMAAKVVSEW